MSEKEESSASLNTQETTVHVGDSGSMASFYALQVALQTMKGLCQQQREQISVLEEENQKLHMAVTQLRDGSFQLRQRNQHLNQSVHQRKQEIQNMQVQLASLSQQQTSLTSRMMRTSNENQRLKNELLQLSQLNASLSLESTTSAPSSPDDEQAQEELEGEHVAFGSFDTQAVEEASEVDSNTIQEIAKQKQIFQEMKVLLIGQQGKLKKHMLNLSLLISKESRPQPSADKAAVGCPGEKDAANAKGSFHSVHLEDDFEALRAWGTPQPSVQQPSGSLEQHERDSSSVEEVPPCLSSTLKPSKNPLWGNLQNERPRVTERVNQGIGDKEGLLAFGAGATASQSATLAAEEGPGEDKVCPICGAMFYRPCPFEAFENHVTSHFDDEDSLLGQFEVVSQNVEVSRRS